MAPPRTIAAPSGLVRQAVVRHGLMRSRRCGRRAGIAGFTLVELVVVIILVAILAVVALPRLNTRTFDTVGFHDEVQATVRFAQKEAVAKRRLVCLAFTATSLTLNYSPAHTPAACTADLVSPRGAGPFVVSAASGVSFTPTPTDFTFDPLGRPSTGQVITVTGDGTRSFTVEAETGHVRP